MSAGIDHPGIDVHRGTLTVWVPLLLFCQMPESSFPMLTAQFQERFGVTGITAPYRAGAADFLVDVREKAEQSISMLPGAVAHDPQSDLLNAPGLREFLENPPENSRLIVYCTVGYRSSRAIASLPEEIKKKIPVFNLQGGIIAHANGGGRLIEPATGRATRKIHAYDSFWKGFVQPPLEAVF
ncbi:MAG: rhodanese-like domain-containing protein [Spirochaetales bacterium]|nr:rhodanese-like domain-containing protein [Spirochaetales bacterium]